MEMVSERSNKGKEKLIEDGDHYPSQNNHPGSLNQHSIWQQQNFGGGGDMRAVEEQQRVAKPLAHSASTGLLPPCDSTIQIKPRRRLRLQWTKKLHDNFIHTMWKLGGPDSAKPKALLEAMAIDGLTLDHVKSRLQSYRKGRITDTWEPPRRPGPSPSCKSNKAGNIDGQKSASSSASTGNREHGRNGPGMGDRNVGGNLETRSVTTPLNSAQQQPHDFNQNKSPEQVQNHPELDERSRTVSAGIFDANAYSIPGPYNNSTISTTINSGIARANGYSIPGSDNNIAHWVQPAQAGGVGLQEQTSNGYSIPRPYNNSTISTAINNVQGGQPEQLYGVTNGIARANGYSIPGSYNNSAHWVQPAQAGGVGLQEQTSNGYSIPRPYNNSTISTAINNVQGSQPEQLYGVTNGIARANGYSIPGPYNNLAHWVQPAQAGGVGLQEQTSNGYSIPGPYNNSAHWVQPAQYGFGLPMQTPSIQNHNGFYNNFQPRNEAHSIQSAEDGVVIQEQPSGLYNPNEVYNETHMIQQPVQDGGALGNIQEQNQYFWLESQAATDTVQAQNAPAIMPDNMVTAENQVEDFLNLDSSELGIADFEIDFDFNEPFGFA